MAEKKEMSQKKRIALFVFLSFVAMAICMGIVMLVAVSLMTDGVYEFSDEPAVEVAVPAEGKETVDFIAGAVDGAKDNDVVYIDTYTDVSVSDWEYSGSDSEKKLLEHMKGQLVSNIDALYPENYSGSFADGFSDFPDVTLPKGKITEAYSVYGQRDENGVLTKDDSTIYSFLTAEGYIPELEKEDDLAVSQKIRQQFSDVVNVISCEVTSERYEIRSAKYADLETSKNPGKLIYVKNIRSYDIALTVEFKNELSPLETRELSFIYTVCEGFNYNWAGISCTKELTVEKGKETQLSVSAVLNDYSEYSTKFVSDNESIATVDSELGYIKGIGESEQPATVTVTLDYLGHVYTAECKVYVKTAVKKIELSERKLALSAGESKTLSASVSPKNATNRNVLWISDDESIARVEDGTVTAAGNGETVIRAVSEDGSYQAICEVTVR